MPSTNPITPASANEAGKPIRTDAVGEGQANYGHREIDPSVCRSDRGGSGVSIGNWPSWLSRSRSGFVGSSSGWFIVVWHGLGINVLLAFLIGTISVANAEICAEGVAGRAFSECRSLNAKAGYMPSFVAGKGIDVGCLSENIEWIAISAPKTKTLGALPALDKGPIGFRGENPFLFSPLGLFRYFVAPRLPWRIVAGANNCKFFALDVSIIDPSDRESNPRSSVHIKDEERPYSFEIYSRALLSGKEGQLLSDFVISSAKGNPLSYSNSDRYSGCKKNEERREGGEPIRISQQPIQTIPDNSYKSVLSVIVVCLFGTILTVVSFVAFAHFTPQGFVLGFLLWILAGWVFSFAFRSSAPLNRRAENVRIAPMVVAELKFRDVQRHIFGADLVERAHDAALEDRPEAFNRIGVHCADNVALGAVHHGLPVVFLQVVVNLVFICRENADIGRNHFANEMLCGILGDAAQSAGDHIALAADSADHWRFTGPCAARFAVVFLIPMPVGVFAANPCFVNFDNAAQLGFRLDKSGADFVAHGMRGPVRAEAHYALDLQGANSLFAGQHQMHDAEPLAQGLVRVLEDGPGDMREAVALSGASVALPFESHRADRKHFDVSTARAGNAARPAASNEILRAGLFIGERRFELRDCHLMNWAGATGHD